MNNDESKQRLHEQQVRFVEEVNTLVKSLERVESHAKGLTQNNMDLRLQLKQAQDENDGTCVPVVRSGLGSLQCLVFEVFGLGG